MGPLKIGALGCSLVSLVVNMVMLVTKVLLSLHVHSAQINDRSWVTNDSRKRGQNHIPARVEQDDRPDERIAINDQDYPTHQWKIASPNTAAPHGTVPTAAVPVCFRLAEVIDISLNYMFFIYIPDRRRRLYAILTVCLCTCVVDGFGPNVPVDELQAWNFWSFSPWKVRVKVRTLDIAPLRIVNHHLRSAQVWHVFSRDPTVLLAHPHVHPLSEWAIPAFAFRL